VTEIKYTKDHEWIKNIDGIGTVGITNNAQEQLGDIVFFELPQLEKKFIKDDQVGVVESVKAASELFTPVSGQIIDVNNELTKTPSLANSDPENSGWFMKIKLDDKNELDDLMSLDQYKEMIKA